MPAKTSSSATGLRTILPPLPLTLRLLTRYLATALTMLVVMTLLTAIIYPALIWIFAKTIFSYQAQGSLLPHGSKLIGQNFTLDDPANPHNPWFIGRPSANLYGSPQVGIHHDHNNDSLKDIIRERQNDIISREHTTVDKIPADALTTSASELDPFISFSYAQLQALRVAKENRLPFDVVENLIFANTYNRNLGFLGQPRVNVVTLNQQLYDYLNDRKTHETLPTTTTPASTTEPTTTSEPSASNP